MSSRPWRTPPRSAGSTPATPSSSRARAGSGSSSSPRARPASRRAARALGAISRGGSFGEVALPRRLREAHRHGHRRVAAAGLRAHGLAVHAAARTAPVDRAQGRQDARPPAARGRGARGCRRQARLPGTIPRDRARRGDSGSLYRQSALAGPNSRPRGGRVRERACAVGVDRQVPRNGGLRTASGPEGSSAKQCHPGAVGEPGRSRRREHRPGPALRRRVHGRFNPSRCGALGSAPRHR